MVNLGIFVLSFHNNGLDFMKIKIDKLKKSFPYLLLLMIVSNVFYFVMKIIHSIFEKKAVEPDLKDLPKIEEEDILGI